MSQVSLPVREWSTSIVQSRMFNPGTYAWERQISTGGGQPTASGKGCLPGRKVSSADRGTCRLCPESRATPGLVIGSWCLPAVA